MLQEQYWSLAMAIWRHPGFTISSRLVERYLSLLGKEGVAVVSWNDKNEDEMRVENMNEAAHGPRENGASSNGHNLAHGDYSRQDTPALGTDRIIPPQSRHTQPSTHPPLRTLFSRPARKLKRLFAAASPPWPLPTRTPSNPRTCFCSRPG